MFRPFWGPDSRILNYMKDIFGQGIPRFCPRNQGFFPEYLQYENLQFFLNGSNGWWSRTSLSPLHLSLTHGKSCQELERRNKIISKFEGFPHKLNWSNIHDSRDASWLHLCFRLGCLVYQIGTASANTTEQELLRLHTVLIALPSRPCEVTLLTKSCLLKAEKCWERLTIVVLLHDFLLQNAIFSRKKNSEKKT